MIPRTNPAGAKQKSADFRSGSENKVVRLGALLAVVIKIGKALFTRDSQDFLTLVEVRKYVSN